MSKIEKVLGLTLVASMVLSACGGRKPSTETDCLNTRATGLQNSLNVDLAGHQNLSIIPEFSQTPLDKCVQIQVTTITDQNLAVITLRGDSRRIPIDIVYPACEAKIPTIQDSPEGKVPFIDSTKKSVCLDWAFKGIPATFKVGPIGNEILVQGFLVQNPKVKGEPDDMTQMVVKLSPDNRFVDFGSGYGVLPLSDLITMLKINLRDGYGNANVTIAELPVFTTSLSQPSQENSIISNVSIPELTSTPTATELPPTYTPTVTMTPTPTLIVGNHSPDSNRIPSGYPIESILIPKTQDGSIIFTIQPNNKLTYHSFVTKGRDNGEQQAKLEAMLANPATNPQDIIDILKKNEKDSSLQWTHWIFNLFRRAQNDILATVHKEKISGSQLILDKYSLVTDGGKTFAFGTNRATGRFTYLEVTADQVKNNQIQITAPSEPSELGIQSNVNVISANLANLIRYKEGRFPNQIENQIVPGFFLMDPEFLTFFNNLNYEDTLAYLKQANDKVASQAIFIIDPLTGAMNPINFPTGMYFEFKGFYRDSSGKEYVLGSYNFTKAFPRELVTEEEAVALYGIQIQNNNSSLFAIPKDMVHVVDPAFYTKDKQPESYLPTPTSTQSPISYNHSTSDSGLTIVIERTKSSLKVTSKTGKTKNIHSDSETFESLAKRRGIKMLNRSLI